MIPYLSLLFHYNEILLFYYCCHINRNRYKNSKNLKNQNESELQLRNIRITKNTIKSLTKLKILTVKNTNKQINRNDACPIKMNLITAVRLYINEIIGKAGKDDMKALIMDKETVLNPKINIIIK